MNLSEIRAMRQTCRAKIEDLLGRTSSRELSTDENQMFTDLKAEGERLASLESRYAVLESFDKGTSAPIVHRPIPPTGTDRAAAISKALDSFLRTGTMATDTPLQIQQSPVSGVAAAVPTDVGILNPHQFHSREFRQYATFLKRIRQGDLAASQFPRTLTDRKGTFAKPTGW